MLRCFCRIGSVFGFLVAATATPRPFVTHDHSTKSWSGHIIPRNAPPVPTDRNGSLHPTTTTLADCLGAKNVPVSFVSSANFAALAKPYNVRLTYTPAVIVVPTTVQHISDAVVCASRSGVKVQPKGGGHSYASFSSGGKNGAVVITLENFHQVTVSSTGVAKVGGGVRLGNLAQGIYDQAKRALPHGTCAGVGVGGHFTHGGYGYDSRKWGLSLDTIVALDVVLANGKIVHASSTQYADLYYALRGAADSFGIVTSFYLQTLPAPSTVINWAFKFPNLYSSIAALTDAFLHIQEFALNKAVIDRNTGFGIHVDGQTFSVSGTYVGTLAHFKSVIQPELLRGLPAPSSTDVQELDWIGSLKNLAGGPLVQPLTGYSADDSFFVKSLVTPESKPLTRAAWRSYADYVISKGVKPPNSWFSIINLYGGPDSQINTKSSSSSAYSDRSALWVFQHYGSPNAAPLPFPQNIQPFIAGLNEAIPLAQPNTKYTAYLNYVDPSYSAAEAHRLYYGRSTYAKLLALKHRFDPLKVFWNPQAIGA